MSGIISDNQGRSTGLIKSAAAGADFEKIVAVTASNVSTADIDGNFSSTYDYYKIMFNQVLGVVDNDSLYMRAMIGGAIKTASTYRYAGGWRDIHTSGGGSSNQGGWNTAFIKLTQYMPATLGVSGEVILFNPLSANYPVFYYSGAGTINAAIQTYAFEGGGIYQDETTAWSGVSFYCPGGNISGEFTLYGIKP